MPIDYSKWDKLELSDDSDVEVHPNVDKKSFIRMKQRQIHEDRVKRDQEIKILSTQNKMYEHLNKRVDSMLEKLSDEDLFVESKRNSFLNRNFDSEETLIGEDLEDLAPYNEMIEDLFTQIFSDNNVKDGVQLRELVKAHRQKIDNIQKKNGEKLVNLLEEKSHHITSEDLHTGFDSFHTNKQEIKTKSSVETKKEKVTEIETLNSPKPLPKLPELTEQPESKKIDEEVPDSYPETEEFGQINMKDLTASAKFLAKNPFIVSVQQKDALLMKAFDYQLNGKEQEAKNAVHQSLLIQFVTDLTKNQQSISVIEKAIGLLFNRMIEDNSPLLKELNTTYTHIKNRCEVLKQEQSGPEEEQIQLKSMDPKSELTITLPEPKDGVKYEEFLKLPKAMQEAVKTKSLDEINKVFTTLKLEESETILDIFEKSGVIGVSAILENEEEFDKLKQEESAIELRSTDPTCELLILKPDPNDEEKYQEFLKLPQEMQDAVMKESLEEVNKVFAGSTSQEETEFLLHTLEGSGVLALYKKQQNLEDELD